MFKNKQRIVFFICALLTIAFSIKSFREPDTWWQLRTGQWILAHLSVPKTDVFSMTEYGKNWINIKWGYEVLIAVFAKIAGPESLPILQAVVSLLILYFLFKIVRLFSFTINYHFVVAYIVLLMGIQYRMITRPEMFSHLFSVVYLYVLLLYDKQGGKLIFSLPLLQVLWTNLHEAFAIGNVLLFVYTLAYCIEQRFKWSTKLLNLLLVCGLSIVSILINPRTTALLKSPFDIFKQVNQNKYTTELHNVLSADYWQLESVLFVLLMLLIAFVFFKRGFSKSLQMFGLSYWVCLSAFVFLGLLAYRNLIFSYLFAFPLLLWLGERLLQQLVVKLKISVSVGQKLVILCAVLLYLFVVSDKYYAWTKSRDHFGLQVLSINNPAGACTAIKNRGLEKQVAFSDYLTSSYALYNLQPNFKTFIDLRDLDVFSATSFDHYTRLIQSPDTFLHDDKKYGFKYVLLFRNSNERLHHYLYNDSIYACVYVDPVAAVYQKTDDFPKGDIFSPCEPLEVGKLAAFVNKALNPAFEYYNYDLVNYDLEAAKYYLNVGKISLAKARVERYLLADPESQEALLLQQKIAELQRKVGR